MSRKLTRKIATIGLAVVTVFSLSMPVANGQSVADLQAQITALLAQIQTLQSQLTNVGGGATGGVLSCNFTRNLTVGSRGADAKCLQQYLNGAGFQVAASGAGSPGNETEYFGSLTKAAAVAWQNANAANVLTPLGLSSGTGFWGSSSIAEYKRLAAATPPPPTTTPPGTPPPPAAVGSGLTVTLASDQPQNALFPKSSANVPFIKLLFTASADGAVTIDALKVERSGSANNAVFDGIIAIDNAGQRIGTSKTLNSNNTAILGDDFVIPAGQTHTIWIAGDAATDLSSYVGQLAMLNLVSVTTKGNTTVNGNFPIIGTTQHTANNSLSIGTATLTRGSLDPGVGLTKEVGTTGYIFSALKVTAGSAEKIRLDAVKFNQSGSAASGDLDNVVISVDGTSYPTTVSSDGKFYSAKIPNGIVIDKGLNKEVVLRGDIVSGSNRTVDFDLFRATDIQVHGLTFGYDIKSTASTTSADNDDDGEFQDSEPFWDAFEAYIGAGSINVSSSNAVPAGNVATNIPDLPLGAFSVDVRGENITVGSTKFHFNNAVGDGGSTDTADIKNITLADVNGVVIAGPADVSGSTVTFSDTITYPVGVNIYTLRGQLSTDYSANETITASTTPSSDWTTVKGTVTNQTITPAPSSAISGNTQTVKSGGLEISVSGVPVAQTIVGGNAFTFANYIFDATASGEDLRVTAMQLNLAFGEVNSSDDLTNCALFDGSTQINTGSDIVNPTNANTTGTDQNFTFTNPVTIAKGTVKTLALQCNTSATTTSTSANHTFTWGTDAGDADTTVTGLTSGQSITETYGSATTGQAITVANGGSFTVAKDDSTSSAANGWVLTSANTTGNTVNALRFTGTNEAVRVTQLGLTLGNTSSNTPQDIVKATLWDGTTQVGETIFNSDKATATLTGFVVPKDADKVLTIKVDTAAIGTSEAGRPGHHVTVEYSAASADGGGNATRGVGEASGSILYATPVGEANDTVSGGIMVFKSFPTIAKIGLTTNDLINGSDKSIYRFSVSAPSTGNGIGLYQFTFDVATSSSHATSPAYSVDQLQVYGFSDSAFSSPAYDNSGRLNSATMGVTGEGAVDDYKFFFDPVTTDGTKAAIQVPAGTTRYFELRGRVNNTYATSTLSVKLLGDSIHGPVSFGTPGDTWIGTGAGSYDFATQAAFVSSSTVLSAFANYGANPPAATSSFVWSGNSTTTSKAAHYDWTNGYRVSGLPSSGLNAESLTP
ncbi:MAG: hypothetical protein COU08_01820 [Candidatus Harrisonbacteria bacterium CG10_big_fil_rev_8_21_14_0_10_42_17]|uniref:Peptidoglycan binding-like domain-containing protein n=1 Tax=Candidatus Harrisonbacteria bacterium CG10_big_fil_rev_8_21_14_0_10_42_17 TaxID=1974584 RepID=A0A2M6WIE9_9BACT|nr:MAG: hypothetical protein COU08_01820 [Candidatus Harrisonbacteria bacterium CG10_big_fil_rev_8_21_14_0_10_42_17]